MAQIHSTTLSSVHKMTSHHLQSPRSQTMATWLFVLLFAWCLASCKTTRQTTSSEESERNAVSLRQWRYALSLSSDSIRRLTALSFDSCTITFGATDKSATLESGESSRPTSSASSGKPKHNKAKPSASTKAQPSSLLGKPTKLTIYGLHFAQSDETMSVSQSTQSDSTSIEAQSSNDKSRQQAKAQAPFIPVKLIALAVLIMAAAIILFIRRIRSAR